MAFCECKHTDAPLFCDGIQKTLDPLISLSGSMSEMTLSAEGTVGRYMHRDLEVVPRDATVLYAADRMRARAIGSVLVESVRPLGGELNMTGIVTETDLVQTVLTKGVDPSRTTVAQVMASPVLTITPDRPMLEASHLMEANRVRHLCVSDRGTIVGLISVRDLVRHFVDAEEGPVDALTDVYRPLGVLMQTMLETIDSDRTVLVAAVRLTEKQIGSLLVVEAGELVGIVTESDLVRKGLALNLEASSTFVRSVMNSPLISIDINRTVRDASALMADKHVRHLAVRESHKIVGIVSARDLVKMVSVRDRPRFLREK